MFVRLYITLKKLYPSVLLNFNETSVPLKLKININNDKKNFFLFDPLIFYF